MMAFYIHLLILALCTRIARGAALIAELHNISWVEELNFVSILQILHAPSQLVVYSSKGVYSNLHLYSVTYVFLDSHAEGHEWLRTHPSVKHVEVDGLLHGFPATTEKDIDRVDQRELPLDGKFTYATPGAGVDIYVLDSGILASHVEFGGRVDGGANFVADQPEDDVADLCNGHGTHVGGLLIGGDSDRGCGRVGSGPTDDGDKEDENERHSRRVA